MKNTVVFSFTILMSLSFSLVSCKHEKDLPSIAKNSCRLDSIIYSYSDFSFTERFFYYPDGKLKKHESNPVQSSEYRYQGKLVIESITTSRYPATDKITYELDEKGLAQKSYDLYADEAGNVIYDTTFYTYNTADYLTKKVRKSTVKDFAQTTIANIETVITYTIVNGNTTEARTFTKSSPGDFTIDQITASYEFYSDKLRKEDGSVVSFLGRGNTNLVKKASITEPEYVPTTTEYTYELNTKGYVSKATANGAPLTYNYTCR